MSDDGVKPSRIDLEGTPLPDNVTIDVTYAGDDVDIDPPAEGTTALVVKESDDSPTVPGVGTVIFDAAGFAVTDNADGSVSVANLAGGYPTGPAWVIDANASPYSCVGDDATDDTAHRQAALDAAVAAAIAGHGVGIVEYDDGIYVHSGALVTAGHYYAQVILPERAGTASKLLIIERPKNRSGVLFPGGIQSSSVVAPVIFRTTLTGASYSGTHGWPSVTGGPDPKKTSTFSNICYHSEGISYRAPANPSLCGINAQLLNQCIVEDVLFDTSDTIAGGITEPTHPTGVAVLMPKEGNNAICEYRGSAWAIGWYAGPGIGEHTRGEQAATYRCKVSVNPQGNYYHAAIFDQVATEHCPYGIATVDPTSGPAAPSGASGYTTFSIDNWTIEHATSGWAMPTADIYDPGNSYRGRARVTIVTAGTGNPAPPQALTLSGAADYGVDYLINGPGGGSGSPTGAAGGDLSGTYPNPSVVDDSHAHTAATLPALGTGGGVGPLLVSDDHSTPILFADLLLTEEGDDLLYADAI